MIRKIRFMLGLFCVATGTTEIIKKLIFTFSKLQFFLFLDSNVVVFFRRSITTANFVPFWSDMDLTLLINETSCERLQKAKKGINRLLKTNPFLFDLELVDGSIYQRWMTSSGYKNWKKDSWHHCHPGILLLDPEVKKLKDEEIGFNLVWEHRFLYEPLSKKFIDFANGHYSQVELLNAYKLLAEIERLWIFWQYREDVPRTKILENYPHYQDIFVFHLEPNVCHLHLQFMVKKFSKMTDALFEEIVKLPGFNDAAFMDVKHSTDQLNEHITFFNLKCFFVRNLDENCVSIVQRYDCLLMTEQMLTLYKLCGVQEIDHLLRLAARPGFEFINDHLIVRLLQDYLQAIFGRKNESVLFFCRKNIDKLFFSRIPPDEAITYCKRLDESDLKHYARVRDRVLRL